MFRCRCLLSFKFLLSFALVVSSLCFLSQLGSCLRQITGTGGLYLLYWALDSQLCIQCWWMFLMNRARCACMCVCVYLYNCCCVHLFAIMCVGCWKWSVENRKGMKIKMAGNMSVGTIHGKIGLHKEEIHRTENWLSCEDCVTWR